MPERLYVRLTGDTSPGPETSAPQGSLVDTPVRPALAPYVASGQIEEAEGRSLLRAAINSVALSQIEERLLFGRTKASAELKAQARVTAELLRDAIRYRAK